MIEQFVGLGLFRSGTLLACLSLASLAFAVAAADAKAVGPRATHFKLANGLEVIVIPDHRAPVVTSMVWYRVGGADEPAGKSGIAHFLEHLMFKGTDEVPPGMFSKIVARNGGEDNAFTNHDVTAYHQRMAKDRLPLILKMEADRMANLRLAENDVLTERKVILEERRSRVDNDPGSILQEQMMAALYQSHPYGVPVIGWENEIKELNRADALSYYERFYAPNNAILIVAGDTTPEEVKTLAEEAFGKLKPSTGLGPRKRPVEPQHYAEVRVTLKDPRAGRPTMQRFYITPSYPNAEPGEAEAIDLLMKIAGDGSTSRIYKKLVVEDRSAQSAGGYYSDAGLDSGRIGFYAVGADAEGLAKAEQGLDQVLADLRDKGVTQKELDRVRTNTIAEYIYMADNQAHLARHYGWRVSAGLTVEDVEEWPSRLEKVTVEDIKRVAKKYLVDKRAVTGILLPEPNTTTKSDEPAVDVSPRSRS